MSRHTFLMAFLLLFAALLLGSCSASSQPSPGATPTHAPATATAQAQACAIAAAVRYLKASEPGVQFYVDGYLSDQNQVAFTITSGTPIHEHVDVRQTGPGCNDWVAGPASPGEVQPGRG